MKRPEIFQNGNAQLEELSKGVRPVNTAGSDCPEGTPFGAKNLF